MSPIEKMLGKQGEPVRCSQWIHWWKTNAKVGDKCLCGKETKEGKPKRKEKL